MPQESVRKIGELLRTVVALYLTQASLQPHTYDAERTPSQMSPTQLTIDKGINSRKTHQQSCSNGLTLEKGERCEWKGYLGNVTV